MQMGLIFFSQCAFLMERRGHIIKLVTCTAVFVCQVLCGSGISYCCQDGTADDLKDGRAVNDKVEMRQNTPPMRV